MPRELVVWVSSHLDSLDNVSLTFSVETARVCMRMRDDSGSKMDASQLIELISEGESYRLEFKRADVRSESLAREMSALLNFEGGWILLGVEDDGSISGLTRRAVEVEEWVMNVADNNLNPRVIPGWSTVELDGRTVGVIELESDGPSKPYKAGSGKTWLSYMRLGSTTRVATIDEERRLFQASGQLDYDVLPVPETTLGDIDLFRVRNYMNVVLGRDTPSLTDSDGWTRLLSNVDLLRPSGGVMRLTVAGLLLFGRSPKRRLKQAGITATAYPGLDKDYDIEDEEVFAGPLVSTREGVDGPLVSNGVIDNAIDFVMRNVGQSAWLDGGVRVNVKHIPREAVREAIVNAVVHRDYTYAGMDIEVSTYADRIEVISPGRLPNGVTVEGMVEGQRASRNEVLKDVLRDCGYVEWQGLGVRRRIVEGMRLHNGTAPDLVEQDTRFIVRLHKGDVRAHRASRSE